MTNIKSTSDLKNVIQQLELQQSAQLTLMKVEFYSMCERLKPINIIKDTCKEVYSDKDIKTTITTNLLGVATGVIARKIILGKSHNPITGFVGVLIEKFISRGIMKNADKIKSVAGNILEKITSNNG